MLLAKVAAVSVDPVKAQVAQSQMFGRPAPNTAISSLSPKAIAERALSAKRLLNQKSLFARYSKPLIAGMRAGLGK